MDTAERRSLAVRVALRVLPGLAALQALYFLLAAEGAPRAVGVVLGVAAILLRRRLAAQVVLAVAIGGNLLAQGRTLGEPVDARLLLVAVILGYLGIVAAAAAALVRRALFLPALLATFSAGGALLIVEVILRPPWHHDAPPGPDFSWRKMLQHPDTTLPDFYRPGSEFIHPYPSNPRDYFERLDPREIRWTLTVSAPAKATLMQDADRPGALRIEIAGAPTDTAWHVQLLEKGLSVTRGDTLTARFRARADRPRTIVVAVTRGRPPWSNLGLRDTVAVDTAWRDFAIPGVARATYPWARLQFDVGADRASVELSDIALFSAASGEPILAEIPGYAVRYAFNDMGCRDRDVPLERAPGTLRILSLGDSYAMGVGVHAPDVFSARLERLLNDAGSRESLRYEVINCGVSGYSTENARVLYQRHLARYDPDLVLLTMVWNDDRSFSDEVRRGFQERRRHLVFRTWRLLDSTVAVRRLRRHDYPGAMRSLEGLRQAVEGRGARFAVILGRNGDRAEWDSLANAVYGSFDTLALPVLDIWRRLGPVSRVEDVTVLGGFDGHPNERAHAIIAEEIRRFLDEKDLLHPRRERAGH